jgi:hypothetical protein
VGKYFWGVMKLFIISYRGYRNFILEEDLDKACQRMAEAQYGDPKYAKPEDVEKIKKYSLIDEIDINVPQIFYEQDNND